VYLASRLSQISLKARCGWQGGKSLFQNCQPFFHLWIIRQYHLLTLSPVVRYILCALSILCYLCRHIAQNLSMFLGTERVSSACSRQYSCAQARIAPAISGVFSKYLVQASVRDTSLIFCKQRIFNTLRFCGVRFDSNPRYHFSTCKTVFRKDYRCRYFPQLSFSSICGTRKVYLALGSSLKARFGWPDVLSHYPASRLYFMILRVVPAFALPLFYVFRSIILKCVSVGHIFALSFMQAVEPSSLTDESVVVVHQWPEGVSSTALWPAIARP
jgi:hypothetical protein